MLQHVESHKELVIATSLDLRFKEKFFTDSEARSTLQDTWWVYCCDFWWLRRGNTKPRSFAKALKAKVLCRSFEQLGVMMTGSSSMTEMEWYLTEPLVDFIDPTHLTGGKKEASICAVISLSKVLSQCKLLLRGCFQLQETFMMKSVTSWHQREQRCYYL